MRACTRKNPSPPPRPPPQRLGVKKALVVHSMGLDELTPMGPADVVEVSEVRGAMAVHWSGRARSCCLATLPSLPPLLPHPVCTPPAVRPGFGPQNSSLLCASP